MAKVISMMVLAMAFCGSAQAQSQLQTARQAHATAEKISSVDLSSYNCSVTDIGVTQGKCQLVFVKDGKNLDLLASAEVAAIYAVATKYAKAPISGLTILVSDNEVIRIEDSTGEAISKKIDFSR